MPKRMVQKLVASVVVDGVNAFGDPVCELRGVVYAGKRIVREISCIGPVPSVDELANTLAAVCQKLVRKVGRG